MNKTDVLSNKTAKHDLLKTCFLKSEYSHFGQTGPTFKPKRNSNKVLNILAIDLNITVDGAVKNRNITKVN